MEGQLYGHRLSHRCKNLVYDLKQQPPATHRQMRTRDNHGEGAGSVLTRLLLRPEPCVPCLLTGRWLNLASVCIAARERQRLKHAEAAHQPHPHAQ